MINPHHGGTDCADHGIRYCRLDFEFTGRFEHGEPELEPIYVEGHAPLIEPAPGAVVEGVLVDCPEGEGGWVVVDTGAERLSVRSPALRHLVVENAPCRLRFQAVPLQDHSGRAWWDWEAHELCPGGAQIIISEPHVEIRSAAAQAWVCELRAITLPALHRQRDGLERRVRRLDEGDLRLAAPSLLPETALDLAKEQFFGPAYRQAASTLAQDTPAILSRFMQALVSPIGSSGRRENPRVVVERFEGYLAHPAISRQLQLRAQEWMRRQERQCAFRRQADAELARLRQLIQSAHDLLEKLEPLGTQVVDLEQSTLALSRHLSVPHEPKANSATTR